MTTFIGIDPGKTGAIARIDGPDVDVHAMPLNADGRVDAAALRSLLMEHKGTFTCVEYVNSFRMGRQSAFVFGQGYGAILATLDVMALPYDLAKPQAWQKAGPGKASKGEQKDRTVAWAMRRWPALEWPTAKAKREAWADALGLAYYAKEIG